MAPVLEPLDEILDDPAKQAVFRTAQDKLVPDPIDYSTWFDAAPEPKRMQAVGVRRYGLVADRLDREPSYADFVSPETGSIMKLADLEEETPEDGLARLQEVLGLFTQRRADIAQVQLFGFL